MAPSSPLNEHNDPSGLVLSSGVVSPKLDGNQDLATRATLVEGLKMEKQTEQWHVEGNESGVARTETDKGASMDWVADVVIPSEDASREEYEAMDWAAEGEKEDADVSRGANKMEETSKSDVVIVTAAKEQSSPRNNSVYTNNPKATDPAALARERESRYQRFIHGLAGNQEHRASTKEEHEARGQDLREKAHAREERAKRRQETKQEKQEKQERQRQEEGEDSLQWPLSGRRGKKQRQLANKRKRKEEEEELVRLRECEKELLALKASLPQVGGVPASNNPLHQDTKPLGVVARVKVLKRARSEQELQQAGEGVADSDNLKASSSALEELVTPGVSHVDADKEIVQGASTSSLTLRKMVNDNGKFQFELMVNLKGINKRGWLDSQAENQGSASPAPEDDTGTVPTITKVAIALENTAEYRISVSGERLRKRLRTRKPTV